MKKLFSVLLILVLLASCLSGMTFAAEAECAYTPAGGATVEGTLKEAAAALTAKGGTIKLLKDVDYSTEKGGTNAIAVESSITLDLNGHTFTADRVLNMTGKGVVDTTHILDSVGGGALVTKNIGIVVNAGALRMENVVCWSEKQQCIAYYDTTDLFNDQNLITGCTLASAGWGPFSFNASSSQAKTSMKIENSTLANLKQASNIVRQSKALAANIEFGANVTLLGASDNSETSVAGGILIKGARPAKQEGTVSFTILDKSFDGLTAWKTGETGEAPAAAPSNPLDRVQPYAPTVSADPKPEQEPYQPQQPAEDTPAEETPVDVVVDAPAKSTDWLDTLSLGISVLSAVMNLVVIILLLKKKK